MSGDAGGGDWHLLRLVGGCKRVCIRDVTFDGSGLTNPDPARQNHLLLIEDGSEDTLVTRCYFTASAGDGARAIGSAASRALRTKIHECVFRDCWRSGISIQHSVQQIEISNCTITNTLNDNCIDCEPSPSETDPPSDVVISNNFINHTNLTTAIHFGGISETYPMLRGRLSGNTIIGGSIYAYSTQESIISNNHITLPSSMTANNPAIDVKGGDRYLTISGNMITSASPAAEACIRIGVVSGSGSTSLVRVLGNMIHLKAAQSGITCESASSVDIHDNTIVSDAAGTLQAISVNAESNSISDISICNNRVSSRSAGSWNNGIYITSKLLNTISRLSILGNQIEGVANDAQAIVFNKPSLNVATYIDTPSIANNLCRVIANTNPVTFGNLPTVAFPLNSLIDGPRGRFALREDFINAVDTFTYGTSGTGAGQTYSSESGRPGIVNFATGTTATGRSTAATQAGSVVFAGGQLEGEFLVRVPVLSNATDGFIVQVGFGDATAADQTDGAYFEYDSTQSTLWRICTASNATRTKSPTTLAPVTAAAWMRLGLVVNFAATSVEYFFNGVSVGVVSTNIPIGAARATGIILRMQKTLGTASRSLEVDYAAVTQTFTTLR
jgi:hypothetical protein